MKKLVVCTILVICLCISAFGCAAGGDAPAGSVAPASEAAESAAGTTQASQEAAGKEGGFKIGFLNGYVGNTWRGQFMEEVENICAEYKEQGILSDYQIASSNDDVTTQLNQLNQMISAGVDALIIDPVSPTAIGTAVQKALDEGIVVVISNDAAAYEGTYFVGNNQDAYTRIGMEWLTTKMKEAGKSNMIYFEGLAGNATETTRTKAKDDVLKQHADIKVLASAPNSWSMTETQAAMSTFLSTYDNIEGVYAPEGMEGVLRAYENTSKDLPITTGDYTYSFLQYWKDHNMDSVVVPSAPSIGASTIKMTVMLLEGKELKEDSLKPNPLDESIVNYIELNPPYTVVTTDDDKKYDFLTQYSGMQLLNIDEALKLCEGQATTYVLDMPPTDEYLGSFFQ